MADDDRSRYRAVLELSHVTRLKGRGDAILPASLPVMAGAHASRHHGSQMQGRIGTIRIAPAADSPRTALKAQVSTPKGPVAMVSNAASAFDADPHGVATCSVRLVRSDLGLA